MISIYKCFSPGLFLLFFFNSNGINVRSFIIVLQIPKILLPFCLFVFVIVYISLLFRLGNLYYSVPFIDNFLSSLHSAIEPIQ